MAKELGFKPRSLIKNVPAKSQPWKAPVGQWIRDLHAKRFGVARESRPNREDEPGPGPQLGPALSPLDQEDLLPQWDTVNEQEYFIRESDGRTFSLEEAGQYFMNRDAVIMPADDNGIGAADEDTSEDFGDFGSFDDDFELAQAETDSQEESMLRRQEHFRLAAEAVAAEMSLLSEVEKVVLFGSVAKPLEREVPRCGKFRWARTETWHECKDVDLAVWVSSLDHLKALQRARNRGVNDLLANRQIGVAHHQVDVFLMEPRTDRYLGRLCIFGQCPKGKMECHRQGCGAKPFLKQHEDFVFDWPAASQGGIILYEGGRGE